MNHGAWTGEMGCRLYQKYAQTVHQVYYDHGKDAKSEPHFCKPIPFFDECTTASTLSAVDIAVVNQKKGAIELIAEVEESSSEPKHVIGDIVNILLSEAVRIKGKDYALGDSVLVLGLRADSRGNAKMKSKRVAAKLQEINRKIGIRRISLVLVFDDDAKKLATKVETEIDRQIARLKPDG
jgi:hypothetical protein